MASLFLLFVAALAAGEELDVGGTPQTLLVCSSADNYVARGLAALEVPHRRASLAEYRQLSPFDYDLILWGLDEDRSVLNEDPAVMRAFVEAGGVLLGFRSNAEDAWLPMPVRRDKAYTLGEILQPEHPIFTAPHRLGREQLSQVHGGSIYRAFFDLGPGWLPLVSTDQEQGWDKTPALDAGPHYGIVELPLGRGRIVLVQMIPAYHWFHDAQGDAAAAGAQLFENLVRYAAGLAPRTAAGRPPRRRPDEFCADWHDVLAAPRRGDGLPLDDPAWQASSSGPYSMQVDRRGVLTLTHADVPSRAGSFAQIRRDVPLDAADGPLTLRWYYSDTYCGGRERILGGAEHGQTALENYKRNVRYATVLVNGQRVWEEDVLGRNPQPAKRLFRTADIRQAVGSAAGRCTITLRVEDRQDSGDEPFAIDAFFGTVEVLAGLRRGAAAELFRGDGFEAGPDGSLRLETAAGAAEMLHTGQEGRFAVALCLRDEHTGQSQIRVSADQRDVVSWTLSADDHRVYWAVSPPLALRPGTPIRIEAGRDGEETVTIYEAAIIPERLLPQRDPPAAPPAAGGAAARRVRFPLRVAELGGVARRGEVAAQGLPFPAQCLPQPDALRVLAPDGRPVAVQTRRIASWPDGSAKSVLVAFAADVAANQTATYTVEAGEGVPPTPAAGGLTLRHEADQLVIDTGVITAVVSTVRGRIVDEVRRGERVIKPAQEVWELVLEDEAGRVVRTGQAAVAETEIVEAGPLRALIVRKGSFTDAAGTLIDYRLQLEATAGSDALRVFAYLINREDQPEVYLKRWSLQLQRPAPVGKVWLADAETREARAGDVLYQHREDSLTWTGADGRRLRQPGRSPGYVRLAGLAVGTRWFWQRFPQAIRFDDASLRFDFIPTAFDEQDLPTRWRDRMLETTDRYSVGGVGYPQSPGKLGLFRLARGQALSQEILFVLDGQDTDAADADLFAALAQPLRGVPAAEYTAGTGAFGEFHPVDLQRYPQYEEGTERTYASILAQREKRREYGFQSFGDSTFEWGYGPSYTYWSNAEYDHHHGYAIQYLRSGDPRWWELCEQTARHYRDVVVIHQAPAGSLQQGGPRHHNATSLWMAQHEEQFWIADHTMAGASAGHSWVEGMIDYWFLTGDPWAGEVVQALADWYSDIAEHNRFGAGGQERGPGWTLIAVSALAKATDGPRIRRAGGIVADWIVDWQDPIRGVVSVPISEQPSYEGGSTFMHGIVGRGLGRWYDVSGDPRVKRAAVGIAEWISAEPMGEPGLFWYKQSPQNNQRYGATDQCLTALSYAYKLSGDRWFAEVAQALLERTGPNRRSMSWYPQSLAQLAALYAETGRTPPAKTAAEEASVPARLPAPAAVE